MSEQSPQPAAAKPSKVFWREVARGVITAVIVAALLAVPVTKIGQWLIKTVVPKQPLRIETGRVNVRFPSGTNSPRLESYVKFETPFAQTPQVDVHYAVFNQGIDDKRNFVFSVVAAEITPQGFHFTGSASYPGATGTIEWLAFGN